MDWEQIASNLINWCMTEGVKIVIAFAVLIIAFIIINCVVKALRKILTKKQVDKTITKTLCYLLNIVLKVLIIVALLGYLGLDTSGIAALIATAGVGIGLALQGSLANVAGGILIIVLRPFRVDDYIEAQGVSGTVEDIHLIYTYIRTPDNKVIALPNGNLANNVMVNYSKKDTRRVDFEFRVSYQDDYKKAQSILLEVMTSHEKALKDPEAMCKIARRETDALILTARVWVKSDDYWDVYFDVLEKAKEKLEAQSINAPFNQLDVHVKNDK